MIVKSFLVEKNIDELKKFKSILIYGENEGLINDIKKSLVEKNKVKPKNYYMSDLLNNSKNVINEFANRSLFGDPSLIFLNNDEDKVAEKIIDLINLEAETKLVVISEKLDAKSKLSAIFEKDKRLACVPCYKDNDYTLMNYAQNKLKNTEGISKEIIQYIIENSDGNKKISPWKLAKKIK